MRSKGWPDGDNQDISWSLYKRRRNKSRRKHKQKLWKSSPHTCFYCEKPLIYEEATLDHVVPLSRGGTNNITNLVICCKVCNKAKGNKLDWKPP